MKARSSEILPYFTGIKLRCLNMKVKLSTKEKFTVIEVIEPVFAANMAVALRDLSESLSSKPPFNIILDMNGVMETDPEMAENIAQVQADTYERGHSFVVCSMNNAVTKTFETADLIDIMNITPTQSEAWDMVQMEEVERELLSDMEQGDE